MSPKHQRIWQLTFGTDRNTYIFVTVLGYESVYTQSAVQWKYIPANLLLRTKVHTLYFKSNKLPTIDNVHHMVEFVFFCIHNAVWSGLTSVHTFYLLHY